MGRAMGAASASPTILYIQVLPFVTIAAGIFYACYATLHIFHYFGHISGSDGFSSATDYLLIHYCYRQMISRQRRRHRQRFHKLKRQMA